MVKPSNNQSELHKQLSKIRDPNVGRVRSFNHEKFKDSFIFGGKEAAEQDLSSIFSIGVEGYNSLIALEPRIQQFHPMFFSEAVKDVDRIYLTEEENDKINANIDQLLVLISPYFLISSTGKVLEWLIRRFRITEFNIDAILGCILPYHDTPQFFKMLSICKLEPTSFWSPLISIRKAKQGLSRSQLVRWFTKDTSILDFFLKWATKVATITPKYSAFFSFHSSVLLSYLQEITSLGEKHLNILLPNVFKGLKQSCSDYKISSFMVFIQLSSKIPMQKELVHDFITLLLNGGLDLNICVAGLVRLAENQPFCFATDTKNNTYFKWIVDQKNFSEVLSIIGKEYKVDVLLNYTVFGLVNEIAEGDDEDKIRLEMIMKLIQPSIPLSPNFVKDICLYIFSLIADPTKDTSNLGVIFPLLEEHGIQMVQSLVSAKLKNISRYQGKDSEIYSKFFKFFYGQFKDSISIPLMETNASLSQSLSHANPKNKIVAIKHLKELLVTREPEVYRTFFPIFIDNLSSTNPYLIEATLDLFHSHPKLLEAIGSDTLWPKIQSLPEKFRHKGLQLLFTKDFVTKNFEACLPSLIEGNILTPSHIQITKLVQGLTKQFKTQSPFLVASDFSKIKEDMSKEVMRQSNKAYIHAVVTALIGNKQLEKELEFAIVLIKNHSSIVVRQVVSLILSLTIKELIDSGKFKYLAITSEFLNILRSFTYNAKATVDGSKDLSLDTVLDVLVNDSDLLETSTMSTISFCLSTLIKAIPSDSKQVSWLSAGAFEEDSLNPLLVGIFSVISSKSLMTFPFLLSSLINTHLKDVIVPFLCHIVISFESDKSTKVSALTLLSFFIKKSNPNAERSYDFQIIIPAILIALRDNDETIRSSGFDCLESLHGVYKVIAKINSKPNLKLFEGVSFYGEDSKLKHLTINSAFFLTQLLINRKAELLSSSDNLKLILDHNLDMIIPTSTFYKKVGLYDNNKNPTSLREPLLNFLVSHIQHLGHTASQSILLELISGIESKNKLRSLSVMISQLLNGYAEGKITNPAKAKLLNLLLDLFTPESLSVLDQGKDRYINIITYALGIDSLVDGARSVSQLILDRISPSVFDSLCQASQSRLLRALIMVNSTNADAAATLAKKVIFALNLTDKPVQDALEEIKAQIVPSIRAPKKQKFTGEVEPVPAQVSPIRALAQLTVLLEVLESQEDGKQFVTLIPHLFGVMTQLVELPSGSLSASINYLYQLVLTSLTTIFSSIDSSHSGPIESATRIDLVVQLLRSEISPQTHHQALLLVSAIASVYPNKVLLHVMPIFTFMGANVLQKDDNYSFFIIQQTLEKIVPPLLASYQETAMNDGEASVELVLMAKPLISVFVNALLHIPQHRRIKLFTILVNVMGIEFLYGVVGTILEIYAVKHSQGARKDADKLKDFCLEVMAQYPPPIQARCMSQLLTSILDLPNEKLDGQDDQYDQIRSIFNVKDHTDKQLRHFKFAIINFVREALANKSFLYGLLEVEPNSPEATFLDEQYIDISERLLQIVDSLRDHHANYIKKEDGTLSVTKFFKSLIALTYDVLNDTISLLSYPCFTMFLQRLLKHKSATIRYRSIHLLNTKLDEIYAQLSLSEVKSFMELVPLLVSIVESDEEVLTNQHLSLECLGHYVKCFIYHHKVKEDKFFATNVLPLALSNHGIYSKAWQLRSAGCLVLSYLCREAESVLIPYIPTLFPKLLEQVKSSLSLTSESIYNTLWHSELMLLESIMTKLAKFTSPYLTTLTTLLIEFKGKLITLSVDPIVKSKVDSLLDMLHRELEPRILLPSIFQLYSVVVDLGPAPLQVLFEIISKVIISLPDQDVTKLYVLLFKFYLECFDIRQSHQKVEHEDLLKMEETILSGFTLLVMKLDDDKFKPIFLKLTEWASQTLKPESQHQFNRLSTFYRLISIMLDKLKHIFNPYFVYSINSAIKLLTQIEPIKDEELWKYVLKCMNLSLIYDSEGFWTHSMLNKLQPALLQQLQLSPNLEMANIYLIPVIIQLANSMNNLTFNKTLNHDICLITRNENQQTKQLSLILLKQLYQVNGKEFQRFLPETVPFLAEVMEDDRDDIVDSIKDLILTIEKVTGESMDQYFR